MKSYINHIAIWTKDLELMKNFYVKYFNCSTNSGYENTVKGFKSYFITLNKNCRIELMQMISHKEIPDYNKSIGLAHIAFSVGSKKNVEELTERMRNDGIKIISEPRTTGDGYYESTIYDPEGNILEITE